MASYTPFGARFYHDNAVILFKVGQMELMVVLGIFFAVLSLIIWRIKGRSISYFVSQFFSIACVILAVGILFDKVVSWRITQHILAEHHLAERNYPQLFGQLPR